MSKKHLGRQSLASTVLKRQETSDKKVSNSAIIWEGKSVFTGENLVAIATGFDTTSNSKLGHNVVQVWILPKDRSPTNAFKANAGVSTCGDCPLKSKVCYVLIHQAPSIIWHTYQNGKYEWLNSQHLKKMIRRQKILRLTAYGDVGAVPTVEPFEALIRASAKTIGYTHSWNTDNRWKGKLMASVESTEDALLAQSLGWQSFRVKSSTDNYILPTEKYCNNYLDDLIQCDRCQLCDGKKQSIVINAHGVDYKVKSFDQLLSPQA